MNLSELPPLPGKFASTVTVGQKGQIVIPKGARDLFGIRPGDTLLLLADVQQGIVIMRQDAFEQLIEQGMSQSLTPPGDPQ
ncbi:MAG: AbrB/MazE/SpoVT family DNA-binding domain-containing protein [Gemmatimonadota bacterium]